MDKEKVIIVTPGQSFFTAPFQRAFERRGFECIEFDYRQGIVFTNEVVRRIVKRFPWLKFIKRWQIARTNYLLVKVVKEYKPKYLFAQKAENIYPETIETIKKIGIITIVFYNDLMNQWDVISKIAPAYDFFFNQCHVVLRRLWYELGLKNCFYLAHSAEPLPESKLVKDKKYNISFIGTYNKKVYPNRDKYLAAIADLGLNIWGTENWAETSLKNYFHGRSFGDQRLGIYAASKIVIDINWEDFPAEGLSDRPFEVAGCGALFMTDGIREDIKRVYREGQEVVLFKDDNDLRGKVQYYLTHNDDREKIALAGYKRTMEDHTYDNRVLQIMDTLNNPEKYLYK
jgi:spore maturation protein CgeB